VKAYRSIDPNLKEAVRNEYAGATSEILDFAQDEKPFRATVFEPIAFGTLPQQSTILAFRPQLSFLQHHVSKITEKAWKLWL
jgi:hypothetical protein